MGFYEKIPESPPDPIFGLSAKYRADTRPSKFTFVTGYFRDENLQTPLLESVVEIEKRLADARNSRVYLPIDGDPEFVEEMGKLVFGEMEDRICGVQTVGGTGALYTMGHLAKNWTDQIAISNPTWANHWKIFADAGLKTNPYPYYAEKEIPFEKMIENLSALPEGSCVLVHTNSHNPTGFDLSQEQWQALVELCEKCNLFPILDMAYQGFSDTPENDAYAPRLFLERGKEFALTYTCAKNFSIYGERAGALFVVAESKKKMDELRSALKSIMRGTYSNPPVHAASIVKGILKDAALKEKWLSELATMRKRMQEVRKNFVDLMTKKDPEGNWEPIRNGRGLFCYSDLPAAAIEKLRDEKGFYLAVDGRINLTGLNQENIEPFTDAIYEAK